MKKIARYKNEHAISYARYGDENGYPLLINHGLIASIDDCGLFERLTDLGAHLISIARPGYGDSSPYVMENIGEWADLAGVVIHELQLARFDVLGMSSGAPYSYAIGYRFPGQVRNIYILSGIPALYDEEVQLHWPFPLTGDTSLAEMQKLARELFFSNLSGEAPERNDIKDSMRNDCFGVAEDLKLRCLDWGFRLSEVQANVYMRHSQSDGAVPFVTALRTAKLLLHCRLEARDNDEHFSQEVLDDYIRTTIAANYESKGNR